MNWGLCLGECYVLEIKQSRGKLDYTVARRGIGATKVSDYGVGSVDILIHSIFIFMRLQPATSERTENPN